MDLNDAHLMARNLMREHGLTNWNFQFDNASRRFGQCRFGRREITLSRSLTYLNDESKVRDTILHEIAHALAGPGAGHGPVWVRTARSIGCSGDRCYSEAQVITPEAPWIGTCPSCGSQKKQHRLTDKAKRVACKRCCDRHNFGRYDARFKYRWLRNHAALI